MKIIIAVPSNRPWVPAFGQSILGLMQHLYTRGANGIKPVHAIFHLQSNASLLPASRQKAIDAAIKEEADYLLMLDDDMNFPPSVLDTLLSRNLDFVAANYVSKGITGRTTAQGANDEKITSLGKTGTEEVGWVGLGVALIRVAAIKNVPRPHFEVLWLEETQSYLGEDYLFSEKLRHAGIKLYVDHDVSNQISHVGDFHYTEKMLHLFSSIN